MHIKGFAAWVALMLVCTAGTAGADDQPNSELQLQNGLVRLTVFTDGGRLVGDRIETTEEGATVAISTDAGFSIDLMWTGWRAPGAIHNADNPTLLDAGRFEVTAHSSIDRDDGGAEINIYLVGTDHPLEAHLTYWLSDGARYVRKRVTVRDPESRRHFVRRLWPFHGSLPGDLEIIKDGGFGEPIAIRTGDGGAFFGIEYPAGTNKIAETPTGAVLRLGHVVGEELGEDGVASEWAVLGLAPDDRVKLWFSRYLDDIRVAPLRPYLLYNTWYDVRSPEYTDRPEDVMNEANLGRIVRDFAAVRETWPQVALDAFVLDDGWDVYASDWVLRKDEFPRGLHPLADHLRLQGTDLGIWFGPIGGYSFRSRRVDWMGEHGYETIGDQLCVAGTQYRNLLRRRTVDLVENEGVRYFKWDGFQFSCSEPDHGHPVGIYSRRAAIQTVEEMAAAVRAANPDVFLNITSGTWLSPWWLLTADTIWMQGRDYGYAEVPSISRRDAAITYRDVVLHEDFKVHDAWFPIANLMTHGIIKGHLQKLGGEEEPLDKFTDNAILYFARGVAMWELYVSPNLLTEAEWRALADSIAWARDRFEVLTATEMVGGDPGAEEAYGYAHFNGRRGVIAARNPSIRAQVLAVELAPAAGLDPDARSLVVERTYPTRWVAPRLAGADEILQLPLGGYETAIYEIYPLEEARWPLLAGVVAEVADDGASYQVLETTAPVRLLNPEAVHGTTVDGAAVAPDRLEIPAVTPSVVVPSASVRAADGGAEVGFVLGGPAADATVALLLRPAGTALPAGVDITLDGKAVESRVVDEEGRWAWHHVDVAPGAHTLQLQITSAEDADGWSGAVSAWLIYDERPQGPTVVFDTAEPSPDPRPMPPSPWPAGAIRRTVELGETEIEVRASAAAQLASDDGLEPGSGIE